MTVNELCKNKDFNEINIADGEREIIGAYCGDLLSWVMGRAEENNAFITIMTNVNVVAVASLVNVSVVIITENAELSEDFIATAKAKEINVVKTPLASYGACAILSKFI